MRAIPWPKAETGADTPLTDCNVAQCYRLFDNRIYLVGWAKAPARRSIQINKLSCAVPTTISIDAKRTVPGGHGARKAYLVDMPCRRLCPPYTLRRRFPSGLLWRTRQRGGSTFAT